MITYRITHNFLHRTVAIIIHTSAALLVWLALHDHKYSYMALLYSAVTFTMANNNMYSYSLPCIVSASSTKINTGQIELRRKGGVRGA